MSDEDFYVSSNLMLQYTSNLDIFVGSQKISAKLLLDIINDDNLYKYILRLFNDEITKAKIAIKGHKETITLNKVEIILGLKEVINKYKVDETFLEKFNKLAEYTKYEKFLQDYKEEKFELLIEGTKYIFPISLFISFFNLPKEKFNYFCGAKEVVKVNGIKKEHFVYAAYMFFKIYALNEYILPDIIIQNYTEIFEKQVPDILAINRILTTKDTNIDKITINEELHDYLMANLKDEYTLLEKAIYIYLKMCRTLTYDDEFYAVDQKGEPALKHQDYNHIKEISLSENEVVCYEFNAIYGKILNELGINFETSQHLKSGFGGHAKLTFRVGKFIVKADAVDSVHDSDLLRAKIKEPLTGLQIQNKNEETRNEYNNTLNKMYKIVLEEEKEENVEVKSETFDEVVDSYLKVTGELPLLSIEERLSILLNKVNSMNLQNIDAYSYILKLRKILFNIYERVEDIEIVIIRNNEVLDKEARASVIITLNSESMKASVSHTYYIYDKEHPYLRRIEKEMIEEKFQSGAWEYINLSDKFIPGIKGRGIK